jgi:hypothetical protein
VYKVRLRDSEHTSRQKEAQKVQKTVAKPGHAERPVVSILHVLADDLGQDARP